MVILLVVDLQRDLEVLMSTDLVTNLALPLSAFIAYFCAGIWTNPN